MAIFGVCVTHFLVTPNEPWGYDIHPIFFHCQIIPPSRQGVGSDPKNKNHENLIGMLPHPPGMFDMATLRSPAKSETFSGLYIERVSVC